MQKLNLPDWNHDHLQADDSAPDWFKRAVNTPVKSNYVIVDDCAIHYLTWEVNDSPRHPQKPGLLFIHGGGAHANWWRFIAPSFIDKYRVAAIDLSGMGDSEKREEYSAALRAQEILHVLKAADLGPQPIVIGHSFGGLMTMRFGADFGDQIGGAIIVDSPVLPESEKVKRIL